MKINFNQKLKNVDGNEVELDLKTVCVNALQFIYNDESELAKDMKKKRWELAKKIKQSTKDVDLTIDDVKMLQDLVCKAYGTATYGPVSDILDA